MLLNKDGEFTEITKELRKIRVYEPDSSFKSVVRTAIVQYEFAAVSEYIVKKMQIKLPIGIKKGLEEEAKLGMADTITQCRMICLDQGWVFDKLQLLGLEHLKERSKDFKKEGYAWNR